MVFQKQRQNTFAKPIIVMVITDGEVSMTNYLEELSVQRGLGFFTLTNLS
jgi:hypothetical protein